MRGKSPRQCNCSHDASDDDAIEQEILNAAAQGVEYGFEQGFEAAIWHLKGIADNIPEDTPGVDFKDALEKVAKNLEKVSVEVREEFMDNLELESAVHAVVPGNSTEH